MADYFLDSSTLAKVYHAEVGSAVVEELVLSSNAILLISRLSVVQVQSAFAGKVRAGMISAGDAAGLRRRFLEDIANGLFSVVALTRDHYDQAGELVERPARSMFAGPWLGGRRLRDARGFAAHGQSARIWSSDPSPC